MRFTVLSNSQNVSNVLLVFLFSLTYEDVRTRLFYLTTEFWKKVGTAFTKSQGFFSCKKKYLIEFISDSQTHNSDGNY